MPSAPFDNNNAGWYGKAGQFLPLVFFCHSKLVKGARLEFFKRLLSISTLKGLDRHHTTMLSERTNLISTLGDMTKYWSPEHVLTMNESHSLKVAKLQGEFIWHAHPDTDELFLCLSGGPFRLEIADAPSGSEKDGFRAVEMKVGDVFNVPKGVRHRPVAPVETGVLLIEKVGTVNTGDEEGKTERTVYVDETKK